jgi:hypothetical protein
MEQKWIDLLKDAVPHPRVALSTTDCPSRLVFATFEIAARKRGLTLSNVPFMTPAIDSDCDQGRELWWSCFETDRSSWSTATYCSIGGALSQVYDQSYRTLAASGCLMSYGVETSRCIGAATYVDRIPKEPNL